MTYYQCELVKYEGMIRWETTTYIPEEFAILNKKLKLKDEEGEWDHGWIVHKIFSKTDSPPDYRKLIRGHRKQTGDSLPKEKK